MTRIQYQECIDACIKCMNACNYSYVSSLKEYDLAALRESIRLDRECADICSFAVQAMTRQSPFVVEILRLCAEICERCADESSRHMQTHCQDCIDACRSAAMACRLISGAVEVYA
ncbi:MULTISPECIES: four-helix bundle copper-binding protein [unclassified Paenibacillus]|uniref:four-helix bundle copper-binding protein n=1 Tax=unclassified Paenibacillus TaxID=185978 RepID=UPI00240609EE|nr:MULTISPECIES: four-helix bundle copper-binding protein [unclassified Paenibacillus]MDF9841009.1 ferredoxin [Paenibacillus sp. PastF-2]MDF9847818.1 ferredoxin [Paenibacillus sp. PastM-2]MDF9854387.1 ferredoxin [Paenibacillus sp. PastF-1]MDH6479442.1 ferredoxin [Paenibacillus sp. PastH-2]MDH6505108.1 ferredoxin [Paenibacillus sp. PastM-3]